MREKCEEKDEEGLCVMQLISVALQRVCNVRSRMSLSTSSRFSRNRLGTIRTDSKMRISLNMWRLFVQHLSH